MQYDYKTLLLSIAGITLVLTGVYVVLNAEDGQILAKEEVFQGRVITEQHIKRDETESK